MYHKEFQSLDSEVPWRSRYATVLHPSEMSFGFIVTLIKSTATLGNL